MRYYLLIFVLYALGYGMYLGGNNTYFSPIELFYNTQHLSPQWLLDHYWQSILYLHAQPPLWNMIIGGVFNISLVYFHHIFIALYFLAGYAAVMFIFATLRLLRVHTAIVVTLVGILCLSPVFHLFGTWYYCTHFELMLFSMALYWLCRFWRDEQKAARSLALAFLCFALLGLMRAQWHLIVFLLFAAGMIAIERRAGMRKLILACMPIFIIPLALLYSKNYLLFGFFGGSSWAGSNLSVVVADSIPKERLAAYRRNGLVHPGFPINILMGNVFRYGHPENVPEDGPVAVSAKLKSNDPAMGNMNGNANHLSVLLTSRFDMESSWYIITHNPVDYLTRVGKQFFLIHFIPASFYPYHGIPRLLEATHYGWWGIWMLGAGLFYGAIPIIALLCEDRARRKRQPNWLAPMMLLYAFACLMLFVGCALNGYEQERMRWGWQAIYIVFAALYLERLRLWLLSRYNVEKPCKPPFLA